MHCRHRDRSARAGFTLAEMLIVIFILMILALLAYTVVGTNTKQEKISGASRHVRSMLEGARDRAIHSRQPRGVRFLVDSQSPENGVFTSMVYIGPAGRLSEGTIVIDRGNRLSTVPGVWTRLAQRGYVPDGSRLRIRDNVYTIVQISASPPVWQLTRNLQGGGQTFRSGQWELELGSMVLSNEEPRSLEGDAVVRIFRPNSTGFNNVRSFDVMFSPRGTIIGSAARQGHVHMLVTSYTDRSLAVGSNSKEDAEVLVTVKTQNGSVSAHSVVPGDIFRNAETGVETE